jgi:hypothetical protein
MALDQLMCFCKGTDQSSIYITEVERNWISQS